jgi:ATP diphosphatase
MERLVGIMARLRAPGGCPWDREQDLRSLRPYLIEEAFEVLDAMDDAVARGETVPGALRELTSELGDLLFQIVFHSQLAQERGEFDLADVAQAISDKIESRHPHVFGTEKVSTSAEVLRNWSVLKAEERKKRGQLNPSAIDGVPRDAPALLRAERTQEKASKVGFDWKDWHGPRAKVTEELRELDEALESGHRDRIEDELGDLLFSLCNLARFTRTPAEDALRKAVRKFDRRFRHVEKLLRERGTEAGKATLEELDALWNQAKAAESQREQP